MYLPSAITENIQNTNNLHSLFVSKRVDQGVPEHLCDIPGISHSGTLHKGSEKCNCQWNLYST